MSKELDKNYNPSEIEDRLYNKWLEKKYFHAEALLTVSANIIYELQNKGKAR